MSLQFQIEKFAGQIRRRRRLFNESLFQDLEEASPLLEEFGEGFAGDLQSVGGRGYGSQAYMAALESSRRAARALVAGQRRHEKDIVSLARTQSAEAIREGSVVNVLRANRREAFEEAEEIHRIGIKQADLFQARVDAEEANRERAESAARWGLVGGITGAAAGAFIGGPAGAAAGYQIGSGIGSYGGAELG